MKKGSITLDKRTGKWTARVTDKNGQRVYVGSFVDEDIAQQAIDDYNAKYIECDYSIFTFEQMFNMMMEEKEHVNNEKTIYNTKAYYKRYLSKIGANKLIDITRKMLQDIIYKIDKPTSQKTVRSIAYSIFEYANKNDVNVRNVAKYVDVKKADTKKIVIFTEKEIKLLWQNQGEFYVDMYLILLYTGCRISELLELKRTSVNIKDMYFKAGTKTETSRNRKIPIADKIKDIFLKYYNEKNEYVISKNGNKINRHAFNANEKVKMEKLIGRHLTTHSTRHTLASRLATVGIDISLIQRILGHKITDFTQKVYIHTEISTLLEAINKLN